MKATRHNGRSGKHGTYDAKHNDRRFDVENSEHIDAERTKMNVYWDCYQGYSLQNDKDERARWKAVNPKKTTEDDDEAGDDSIGSDIEEGRIIRLSEAKCKAGKTTPPKSFTDVIHFESRQWKYSKCKGAG